MPQITPVLESVNDLLDSVPEARTRRVLDQVDEGLGGAGPDLARTIDETDELITEAQRQITSTTSLIDALDPVLGTQQDLREETAGYASSLGSFTTELAGRDRDLRALLSDGAPGLRAAGDLVAGLQATLPLLVTNLTTNAEVLNTYLPQIKEGLVYYPVTVARLQSAINPRSRYGDVNLDLRVNANRPPACSEGYLAPSERRDPSARSTRKVDLLAHCEVPTDDARSVRGARLLPCPQGSGRGPLPAACGLRFGEGVWPGQDRKRSLHRGLDGTHDDESASGSPRSDRSWKVLVLRPLGLQ
jgi:phospholipid/cholesterol/gamma-HCH transport system substrate-binding protein